MDRENSEERNQLHLSFGKKEVENEIMPSSSPDDNVGPKQRITEIMEINWLTRHIRQHILGNYQSVSRQLDGFQWWNF